ncbi:hypothetical protein ACIQTZ_22950 [Paenarthrobacter sp. NPDC090520]|uniref:hypothetical protein n=1 Tax=Paenarthrobacter sp. NPDC090520 TaxID=3364382 RepID=UPI0038007573
MAPIRFHDIFIEEVAEQITPDGDLCDGYTLVKGTGKIAAREVREHIIGRVPYLKNLLELEEAGEQPAGIQLSENSLSTTDPRGLFHTGLHHTMASMIGMINTRQPQDGNGVPSVDGVNYSVILAGEPGTEETQIMIWTHKSVAKELVESGQLDLEAFSIESKPWPEDGIHEAYNECLGTLVAEQATRPFYSSDCLDKDAAS